jgi:5-methylcytosine-specific restriction endonuclease McrA
MEKGDVKIDIRKIKDSEFCQITTKIKFEGDIRNLKNYLISKSKFLPDPNPIPKVKREIPRELFVQVYNKFNGKCAKCEEKGKEVHHKIPFVINPLHELENLLLLCKKCHKEIHKNHPVMEINIQKKEGENE